MVLKLTCAVLAGDALGHRDALFLGLVRQHRAAHDVADRPDVRQVGLAVVVDHDGAALVELQADRLGVQADGVGHAADRDDQLVARRASAPRPWRRCRRPRRPSSPVFDLADLDAELDLQALLGEGLLRLLGDLLVDRAEEGRQRFEHRHLGAEAAPHRAHLEADHARADHAQRLRHRRRCAARRRWRGCVSSSNAAPGKARGFEPVATMTCLPPSVSRLGAGDRDLVAALARLRERAAAVEERDLVLLEQVEDAVVVLLHDRVLARQHLRHVELRSVDARCRGRRSGGRRARSARVDCSSAFDGMQPTLVQVPPGAGPPLSFFHSSMQAVLKPSCAARMAAM